MVPRQKLVESKLNANKISATSDNFLKLKVFAFQPDEKFYFRSFEERLQIVEERVLLAKKMVQGSVEQEDNRDPLESKKFKWFGFKDTKSQLKKLELASDATQPLAIFVAPEYLFKNLSGLCYQRYYTWEQKNAFKKRLRALSLDTDMLIVPGTICWYKEAKTSQNIYYRNTAYFFYRGNIQKYKKRYPHTCYDFDYTDEGFLNLMDLRRLYFKSGEKDAAVKDYFGMKLGVEICYDSVRGSLARVIKEKNIPLDIQLIIADGAKEATIVERDGLLLIKIERNAEESKIGRIIIKDNKNAELIPAMASNCFETNDLISFQFR
ncbi:nitrilase-related carbon-nitrogen hydrolase [Legionella cardiaca]|uniref:CN hydrolase domain-containing protein n=1 Tax=Legionella cardiaca TaxID=1071983 RepID=A0ABY8ARD4_9GAMM|nr:nitrilase-related carbon-nitrogen hydrolase [Legionella cardiaca]WED43247.1 hypothetical protein PXX05_00275 [Legionella cardiaca]